MSSCHADGTIFLKIFYAKKVILCFGLLQSTTRHRCCYLPPMIMPMESIPAENGLKIVKSEKICKNMIFLDLTVISLVHYLFSDLYSLLIAGSYPSRPYRTSSPPDGRRDHRRGRCSTDPLSPRFHPM